MASSLVLPSAGSLAGQWVITDKGVSCRVRLETQEMSSANGYALTLLTPCPEQLLPASSVAWRPAPDGIELLAHDGSSTVFFSREGNHYRSDIWNDTGKILKRKAG
ncbi:AprI/Inh family metalloprotease inhibitor [Enterobacteriaceae bacterium 4M9]|nr:AprI/Inh family metalloprotease inhibitor [Enterobacteriaceae bacterium 4M9]